MKKVIFTLSFFANYLCAADNFQDLHAYNYDENIGYREPPPSPIMLCNQSTNEVEYQKKALREVLQKNLTNALKNLSIFEQ